MADSNMCVKTTAAADRMESFLELGDGELVHEQLAYSKQGPDDLQI